MSSWQKLGMRVVAVLCACVLVACNSNTSSPDNTNGNPGAGVENLNGNNANDTGIDDPGVVNDNSGLPGSAGTAQPTSP